MIHTRRVRGRARLARRTRAGWVGLPVVSKATTPATREVFVTTSAVGCTSGVLLAPRDGSAWRSEFFCAPPVAEAHAKHASESGDRDDGGDASANPPALRLSRRSGALACRGAVRHRLLRRPPRRPGRVRATTEAARSSRVGDARAPRSGGRGSLGHGASSSTRRGDEEATDHALFGVARHRPEVLIAARCRRREEDGAGMRPCRSRLTEEPARSAGEDCGRGRHRRPRRPRSRGGHDQTVGHVRVCVDELDAHLATSGHDDTRVRDAGDAEALPRHRRAGEHDEADRPRGERQAVGDAIRGRRGGGLVSEALGLGGAHAGARGAREEVAHHASRVRAVRTQRAGERLAAHPPGRARPAVIPASPPPPLIQPSVPGAQFAPSIQSGPEVATTEWEEWSEQEVTLRTADGAPRKESARSTPSPAAASTPPRIALTKRVRCAVLGDEVATEMVAFSPRCGERDPTRAGVSERRHGAAGAHGAATGA